MYQCQMGKQTLASPLHTWHINSETKLYRLQTPNSPFFRPAHYDYIGKVKAKSVRSLKSNLLNSKLKLLLFLIFFCIKRGDLRQRKKWEGFNFGQR